MRSLDLIEINNVGHCVWPKQYKTKLIFANIGKQYEGFCDMRSNLGSSSFSYFFLYNKRVTDVFLAGLHECALGTRNALWFVCVLNINRIHVQLHAVVINNSSFMFNVHHSPYAMRLQCSIALALFR